MIALGLKVDEKSFQAGEAAFGGLTKSALQLGAVLASKLAIDKVVGDFKNAGTELNNFNKLTGLSTQRAQAFGQALSAQGGNAMDALDQLTKMQDLMKSPMTGNAGAMAWMGEVAKFGLDPNVVLNAKSTTEAFESIAFAIEKMPKLKQRMIVNALGFNDDTNRMLMTGGKNVTDLLEPMGKLGIMTEKQVEDAARLTRATSALDLVFTDIGNTIAGELAPAFADMAEDFVAFYRDNKDLIDSGLKEFFGELADNIELVAIAMALLGGSAALKGLASLRAIVGLGGAGAGAGAAGAAAAGGASMLTVAGGSVAALLYSSKLNEGEDTELLNNRLKKGGGEAVGAVVDFFMAKGWTREQAEGIAANLEQESDFKADAEGDGGQAYGLAQWHPDRQAEFAKKYGKDIRKSTGAEQLEFINHELTRGNEQSAGNSLKTATNAYDAAAIVSRQYERPGVDDMAKDREAASRADRADSYRSRTAPTDRRAPPSAYDANSVVAPAASPTAPDQGGVVPGDKAAPSYSDNRQFHIHGADVGKVKQIINEQMSGLTEKTMQDFRSPEK